MIFEIALLFSLIFFLSDQNKRGKTTIVDGATMLCCLFGIQGRKWFRKLLAHVLGQTMQEFEVPVPI
jgi:hypothetical protein